MTPEETNQSGKAFNEITLSLSGGGFRAAAFHLGAMKMLDCLGLLDQVRVLSTVSGGTIVGAAWANSLSEGKNFGQFYGEFKNFLQNNNVIEKALNNLSASVSINDFAAMPSLIRAAAAVYAESRFLGEQTRLSERLSSPQTERERNLKKSFLTRPIFAPEIVFAFSTATARA